jgi:two-component system phosphate regulon sensor histidine kinase PhoR
MKSDFINRASHELRTPLTSAIMMVDLIQSGGTPQELEEYWTILNSELNRQKILIDRLLIAGRLESGMMNLEIVPTNLVAVLEESVQAVKPIANKKKISINLELPAQYINILGDKSGLQQVFINLINNATKFSPDESIVTVSVSILDKDIHIAITDKGMGIPTEDIPKLFDRFYRGRNVTIAEIPGSGVGLYIVKTIVQQLGGNINIYSEPNVGSTFTVILKSAD